MDHFWLWIIGAILAPSAIAFFCIWLMAREADKATRPGSRFPWSDRHREYRHQSKWNRQIKF